MSHQVQEMTNHPGWAYLVDRSAVTTSSKQRSVLNGKVETIDDYKKLTGWLEGATFILTLPERMNKEIEDLRSERAEAEREAK